ncbi:hypothetical protein E1265_05555 [Streptomyces sp. 8K308]|uniref:hypothetical protein n=1 Tax=Streptomyces sp. 8K308 TaxID=2530388 RepID=UPI0010522AAC|nr:hypothetical protein [Streptomyces sp. 8K308]TDC25965.1 hypothetical protein E1265_05555 [Streptomyces sp. 8K308]
MSFEDPGRSADLLAAVCGHAKEIRADLLHGSGGGAAPLDDVLAAMAAGDDLAAPLEALHAVLRASGDALGLLGYSDHVATTRGLEPAGIVGVEDGLVETVYLCPAGRCTRYWFPVGSAPVPHCRFDDVPLRGERL